MKNVIYNISKYIGGFFLYIRKQNIKFLIKENEYLILKNQF